MYYILTSLLRRNEATQSQFQSETYRVPKKTSVLRVQNIADGSQEMFSTTGSLIDTGTY